MGKEEKTDEMDENQSVMEVKMKKHVALLLVVTLLITLLVPVNVSADTKEEAKQEVVYVTLDAAGAVSGIYVVNIFDLPEGESFVDYGDYESIRNMTSTLPLFYDGEEISGQSAGQKIYYEGILDSAKLPWEIAIEYYLDGIKYPTGELAGESGELEITISIQENKDYTGMFFDHFALQVSLSLDTGHCKNIVAEGATGANVGKERQLTYTVLPGNKLDASITAQVSDFEMDGISVNGLPLSMHVEVDDEELLEQITELLDGIVKLDDGAIELEDGVSSLQNGVEDDLQDGVSELRDGAELLQSGAGELKNGSSNLKRGASDLKDGAAALDTGVHSLLAGIQQVEEGLNTLHAKSAQLTGGSSQVKGALLQIQETLNGVSASTDSLQLLLDSSAAIKQGLGSLTDGAAALQQAVSFQAYKTAMEQNGLDIDTLKAGNDAAIEQLSMMVSGLQQQIAALQQAGADPETLVPLQTQAEQLQQIMVLLTGNNASISGTEGYFNALSQNVDALVEGITNLRDIYQQFDAGLNQMAGTLGELLYNLSELSGAINSLVEAYQSLDSGITEYTKGVAAILSGYAQVTDGAARLAAGSRTLKDGSNTLYSGTADLLNGIVAFYDATGTLKDGTGKLDDGVAELLVGIANLYDGAGKVKDGTGQLRDETDGMDTAITDEIDELLASITGGAVEIMSFVSERNTNVESVQFVMKTASIKKEEAEDIVEEETKEKGFIEKFLHLFGGDK